MPKKVFMPFRTLKEKYDIEFTNGKYCVIDLKTHKKLSCVKKLSNLNKKYTKMVKTKKEMKKLEKRGRI